ncbi:MAG: pyridoxamine 5'-phosphate oxidase family protein [Actinomycetota bacterium]|nr:pyridoxamine 5'-phosphate oxidase family protein [Actinomycetota bacterium]
MTDPRDHHPLPVRAVNIVRQWDDDRLQPRDPDAVLPWELGLERLSAPELYWNVTVTGGDAPHVRPVFAVVADGVLCTTTSATARKTQLLLTEPRCTFATSADGMDLVYEGIAARVDDRDRLDRVAAAYRDKYGWPVDVAGADAGLHAPFAAPTAGPPPYVVFAIEPVTVYGLGTDEAHAPRSTRWEFAR